MFFQKIKSRMKPADLDDSLRDFYTTLSRFFKKIPNAATNNVITGFVENGREDMLTLEQIKVMKQKGMSEDHRRIIQIYPLPVLKHKRQNCKLLSNI